MIHDKIILTDCDGVLLDWEKAFDNWMADNGYIIKQKAVYDISKKYGIEKVIGKARVKQFNESAWMGYLHALRDARSGVAKLYEHGYRFHCITSLSLDKKAQRLRQYNLENIFGKGTFKELICLDTGADKDEVLQQYKDSGLWWIEDKPSNAIAGKNVGLKPILINHSHNLNFDDDDIVKVNNWVELCSVILD